jgi:tetratricopeptide (TPR) repeat protein
VIVRHRLLLIAIGGVRELVGAVPRAAVVVGILLAVSCNRGPVPPDLSALGSLDPAVLTLLRDLKARVDDRRSDAGGWGRLGMGFEANGLLVEAEDAYDTAVMLEDNEPRWRYRRALLRARRGETSEALADLARVIALAPAYAPARWRQGLWLLDRGDSDSAETSMREAIRIAPDDPAGQIGLARVQLTLRQDAAAAETLDSFLAVHPGQRYALHLIGTAYRRLGRDEDARVALALGSTGEPEWHDPWSNEVAQYQRGFAAELKHATALGMEGRYDEAITLLQRLVAERPDDTALRVYLGGMYASARRLREAEALLLPILVENPEQFDAQMHLASAYLFARALDKADQHAARALALRPSSADATRLRGVVRWQQGRADDAARLFEATVARDPRDPMPHLWIGMIHGERGQYIAARRRFELALERNPLLGDALIGIADTHAALGEFAAAERMLARASQAEPGNPHLAEAQARIGAAARAVR